METGRTTKPSKWQQGFRPCLFHCLRLDYGGFGQFGKTGISLPFKKGCKRAIYQMKGHLFCLSYNTNIDAIR